MWQQPMRHRPDESGRGILEQDLRRPKSKVHLGDMHKLPLHRILPGRLEQIRHHLRPVHQLMALAHRRNNVADRLRSTATTCSRRCNTPSSRLKPKAKWRDLFKSRFLRSMPIASGFRSKCRRKPSTSLTSVPSVAATRRQKNRFKCGVCRTRLTYAG